MRRLLNGPATTAPSEVDPTGVRLDASWAMSPSVALRPEPFGALAYHFGNRRLTFIKRPDLVAVVRDLGAAGSVRAALEGAGVPEPRWPAYLRALSGLAAADMIRPVPASNDPASNGA